MISGRALYTGALDLSEAIGILKASQPPVTKRKSLV
jgi:hypothetical protein